MFTATGVDPGTNHGIWSFYTLRTMLRKILGILSVSTALFIFGEAQAQRENPQAATLNPTDLERVKVGDRAPDFTLEDMDGKRISLSDFHGRRKVVLVFYRGHWWPYCASQLGELKGLLTAEEKRQVQILAISIDSHADSRRLVKRLQESSSGEVDFPLLEDKSHEVIGRYGILNPHSPGWPHPAIYVLDRAGIVRWRFVEKDYTQRASNEQILQALKAIP
jgi:peroxiredoxin